MSGFIIKECKAIFAIVSIASAFLTESCGDFPQVKTPWLLTRMPGHLKGVVFNLLSVSIITNPVFFS